MVDCPSISSTPTTNCYCKVSSYCCDSAPKPYKQTSSSLFLSDGVKIAYMNAGANENGSPKGQDSKLIYYA